jgi:hypothetical protein
MCLNGTKTVEIQPQTQLAHASEAKNLDTSKNLIFAVCLR